MDLKILKEDKEEIEVEIDNVTLAEVLRVYLNENSDVSFAAWKREHPTKNPVLKVKAKNPKKAIKEAVSTVSKELDKVEKDFASLK
jgi:DNA-directed RNA polymerase subunit L